MSLSDKLSSRRAVLAPVRHRGWTLVELLVVLAVIGILLGLILPAIQQAREAARRTQCRSHLKQIGLAIHAYTEVHGILPPGNSNGFSFHVSLLPYIDQKPLSAEIGDTFPGIPTPPWAMGTLIPLYICPSDGSATGGSTNYRGNAGTGVQRYDYNGVFQILRGDAGHKSGPVRPGDISDGLSQTAAVAEQLVGDGTLHPLRIKYNTAYQLTMPDELEAFAELCRGLTPSGGHSMQLWSLGRPWYDGNPSATIYNHVLTPNQNSCNNGAAAQYGAATASSLHSAGINLLFADGHVTTLTESIDGEVWRAIGSRNGGETVTFP